MSFRNASSLDTTKGRKTLMEHAAHNNCHLSILYFIYYHIKFVIFQIKCEEITFRLLIAPMKYRNKLEDGATHFFNH